jgi:hypothetical protein
MNRLPAKGTKDRAKLEAMLRVGTPRGVSKLDLREIDGGDGYGTYKRDGKRYAAFLGGTLRVWGSGDSERYWIEMPKDWKGLENIESRNSN